MNEGERKRAALWTVGRGSRALLRYNTAESSTILAATALTSQQNKIYVLAVDQQSNLLIPVSTLATPSEVWSQQFIKTDANDLHIVAASRCGRKSAVEIWSLPDVSTSRQVSASDTSLSSSTEDFPPVRRIAHMPVEGSALKISANHTQSAYLCMTESNANVVDVDSSLQISVSASIDTAKLGTGNSMPFDLRDCGWVDNNTAYIAARDAVGIVDKRTGAIEQVLNIKDAIEKSRPDGARLWLAPSASRVASAASDADNVLYTGTENGCLRAFDVRYSRMLWQVVDAHSQWVSALCTAEHGAILSGGMDGVVRYWSREGASLGTFPQHDDIVTNVTCADGSFVSISYDGRVALNEIPLVA